MEKRKIIILHKGKYKDNKKWVNKFIKNRSVNWIIVDKESIGDILNDTSNVKKDLFVNYIENYIIKGSLLRRFDVIIISLNKQQKEYDKILSIKDEYSHIMDLEIEFKDITLEHKWYNYFYKKRD